MFNAKAWKFIMFDTQLQPSAVSHWYQIQIQVVERKKANESCRERYTEKKEWKIIDWKFSSIFQIGSLFTLINCIIKLYFTHRSILSFFRHRIEFSLWTFIDFQLFPNRNQIIKSKIQLDIQHRVKLNTKRIRFGLLKSAHSLLFDLSLRPT